MACPLRTDCCRRCAGRCEPPDVLAFDPDPFTNALARPMTDTEVAALATRVLWVGFGLSVMFGAIAQRTHFCTMGAIADVVNMGDWTRARMWVLAIAVATLGFNAMVAAGWVEAKNTVYAAPRLNWLSAVVGGLLFGFGMVLASGCGSKSLMRVGSGNLKSLVVVLVLGLSALITLRGLTAVWRAATVDAVHLTLPTGQDLPSMFAAATGLAVPQLALVLGGLVSTLLVAWVLRRPEGRQAEVLFGGIGVGVVIVALWWTSGRLGHVPEDPRTLEAAFLATNSRRMESLSMVAPVGYALDWLMFYSDAAKVLTLGVVSALGLVVGSLAVSLATRSFRWEGFRGTEDVANHLIGATLMGVGGVTAIGCTIGQGLSGVSTLALGSFIALAGIVGGAVLALRYQMWRMERLA